MILAKNAVLKYLLNALSVSGLPLLSSNYINILAIKSTIAQILLTMSTILMASCFFIVKTVIIRAKTVLGLILINVHNAVKIISVVLLRIEFLI